MDQVSAAKFSLYFLYFCSKLIINYYQYII
jgi:hypothetical protein